MVVWLVKKNPINISERDCVSILNYFNPEI